MIKRPIFILLWLIAVAAILAWTLTRLHAQINSQLKFEILLHHALVMMLLTLPSGLIFTGLVSAITSVFGFEPAGAIDAVIVSVSCTIAGYLQWFILVPWLWCNWKAKRDSLNKK